MLEQGSKPVENQEIDNLIRVKLMQNANQADFEEKLESSAANMVLNREERRKLNFRGLTSNEYHYYFDKLFKDHHKAKPSKSVCPSQMKLELQLQKTVTKSYTWTIEPSDQWYNKFDYLKKLCSIVSVICYP